MYRHLLVASDGSELAGHALATGLALAGALQAKVTLVTVSEPWLDPLPGDPTGLALATELRDEQRLAARTAAERVIAAARTRAEAAGVALEGVYVPERLPAEAILETARACGADLVVMASHGRRGLQRLLLGSQTQSVVSGGHLPVLVVR
jgi:nucleotide-binding universal stress UspA family protein